MKRKFKKHYSFKENISLVRLIPNLITLSALCIGLSSIRFALDEKWELAVICILISAFLDGIDGKIARLLNASSSFGAELDSLCDFVNFGISPSILIYLWIFDDYKIKVVSWAIVLFYCVCSALRLARFNTISINHSLKDGFFIGMPSPAAGIICLVPLICEFDIINYTNFSFHSHPLLIGIYQTIIGILMASRIPTFSFKDLKISPKYLWIYLILFSTIVILMFLYTWYIIPFLCLIYVLTIPISYLKYSKEL